MASKTILITGASGGLGAALARAHARAGVQLVLWGRDGARLESAAQPCRQMGAETRIDIFDLRDMQLLEARLAALGAVDLAIFNAGLGGSVSNGAVAEPDPLSTALVNFVAPVLGANRMATMMAKAGGGRIVLIGSIAESYPLPMAPTYAATKAGLAMFAEALSLRLAKHGVKIVLVSPGFIDTPMSRQVAEPKPWLMGADAAARIIAARVARGDQHIVVPWQFAVLRALTNLLPRALVRRVLSRA
jgi:short-subunit dehydrogenase